MCCVGQLHIMSYHTMSYHVNSLIFSPLLPSPLHFTSLLSPLLFSSLLFTSLSSSLLFFSLHFTSLLLSWNLTVRHAVRARPYVQITDSKNYSLKWRILYLIIVIYVFYVIFATHQTGGSSIFFSKNIKWSSKRPDGTMCNR